jgi:hypothetical protein
MLTWLFFFIEWRVVAQEERFKLTTLETLVPKASTRTNWESWVGQNSLTIIVEPRLHSICARISVHLLASRYECQIQSSHSISKSLQIFLHKLQSSALTCMSLLRTLTTFRASSCSSTFLYPLSYKLQTFKGRQGNIQ